MGQGLAQHSTAAMRWTPPPSRGHWPYSLLHPLTLVPLDRVLQCLLEKLKTMNNPKYKPQPPEKVSERRAVGSLACPCQTTCTSS